MGKPRASWPVKQKTVDFHEEPTSHQTGTSPAKPGSELRTASISSSSMESECPSLKAIIKVWFQLLVINSAFFGTRFRTFSNRARNHHFWSKNGSSSGAIPLAAGSRVFIFYDERADPESCCSSREKRLSIPSASKSVGVFLLSNAGRTDYLIAALA